MIEPTTIPGPDDPPRDTHDCPHALEYGRVIAMGEIVVRCQRCGAPVAFVAPPSTRCSCQRANAYATECLLSARCQEGH